MKYKYIYFDLDGTLIDSSQGVVNSALYALEKHNMSDYNIELIKQTLIGPPLYEGLKNLTSLNDEEMIFDLIKAFREDYANRGVYQNSLFDGIKELLEELKMNSCHIEILTSKPEKFALEIVKQHSIEHYFDKIDGAGEHDKKSSKIDKLKLSTMNHKKNAVMIGDRLEDIIAGQKNDIATLAVTYGFDSTELLKQQDPTYLVDNVLDIGKIIKGY